MAKKIKKTKRGSTTKTEAPKSTQLVISELNIMSPDRNTKDIGEFKTALLSAESVYYPNRVRLYDLYDAGTLDGHLTGLLLKRFNAVLNKKLYFEVNEKRVDELDELIGSLAFRNIITKILETPAYGITGMEFVPGSKLCFKEIPRKHIKPHKKMLAIEQYDDTGIAYEGVSNLWIIGEEKDLGYLLKCMPYAIWKSGNMGDWAQYIEIFGQPVRIIYYDAYDEKTKMELRQVLDESGSSLAMMVPKQAQFEMKDGKGTSNGTGELQDRFKVACNDEMSVIVLGNTETTTSSSSSGYAQSKEHGKQQLEVTKSDMQFVLNHLNAEWFINILKSYGYPVEGGHFKFEKEIDITQLAERIKIDKEIVVSLKTPISDDYVYETYGIPKPDNYDELIAKREAEHQAIMGNPDPEDDPEKLDPAKKPPAKPVKKPAEPPVKKNLKATNFWFELRAALADFFDPAP